MSAIPISDLARAAYCPRQLYYARRAASTDDAGSGGKPPPEIRARQGLAFRYAELRQADDASLAAAPVALPPPTYRTALDRLTRREDWNALADPPRRDVVLEGKDCRGVAHKVLPGDDGPPVPTFASPGEPPDEGVWEHQRVRGVALAKALAWEREREVDRALIEYPTHGVIRTVRLTTRNRAIYRAAVRTVRSLDGPPPRLRNDPKCDGCDFREQCGVRTRSLRSLLGL